MTPKDDCNFYSGKETNIGKFRGSIAEQEERDEQKIQQTSDNLLSEYRKQKSQTNQNIEKTKKAFKFQYSLSNFEQQFIAKKKISNSKHLENHILLSPCIFLEYQYLKKVNLQGQKNPLKGSTVLSLYEPDRCWRPELCREINENNLMDANEGYIIEYTVDHAEEQIAMLLSVAKNDSSNRFSPWRKKLNINGSPKDIQSILRIDVIYLPFWLAKFQTNRGIEYFICDRIGIENDFISRTINLEKLTKLELK